MFSCEATPPETLTDGVEVQLPEVAAPEPAELITSFIEDTPIPEGPVAEQQASAPQSPTLLPAEPFNAEVSIEPEQQQLPTPPAEQELYSHCEPVEHDLNETQPAPVAEEAEESMAAEAGIIQQDSAATLIGEPPMVDVKEEPHVVAATDAEKELPATGTIEKELFDAPVAPVAESTIPQRAEPGEGYR
jgi:hypothetical protein